MVAVEAGRRCGTCSPTKAPEPIDRPVLRMSRFSIAYSDRTRRSPHREFQARPHPSNRDPRHLRDRIDVTGAPADPSGALAEPAHQESSPDRSSAFSLITEAPEANPTHSTGSGDHAGNPCGATKSVYVQGEDRVKKARRSTAEPELRYNAPHSGRPPGPRITIMGSTEND